MLRLIVSLCLCIFAACESAQNLGVDSVESSAEPEAESGCLTIVEPATTEYYLGFRCIYQYDLGPLLIQNCNALGLALRDYLDEQVRLVVSRSSQPENNPYANFGSLETLGRKKALFHNLNPSSMVAGSLRTPRTSQQLIVLLRSWNQLAPSLKRPQYWLELSVPIEGAMGSSARVTLFGMGPFCDHVQAEATRLQKEQSEIVHDYIIDRQANPMLGMFDKMKALNSSFEEHHCNGVIFTPR